MSFAEFLEKLRDVAGIEKFYLTETQKWIRTKEGCLCPIESVANTCIAPTVIVGHELGLNFPVIYDIIYAADNRPGYEATREKLLQACGLVS